MGDKAHFNMGLSKSRISLGDEKDGEAHRVDLHEFSRMVSRLSARTPSDVEPLSLLRAGLLEHITGLLEHANEDAEKRLQMRQTELSKAYQDKIQKIQDELNGQISQMRSEMDSLEETKGKAEQIAFLNHVSSLLQKHIADDARSHANQLQEEANKRAEEAADKQSLALDAERQAENLRELLDGERARHARELAHEKERSGQKDDQLTRLWKQLKEAQDEIDRLNKRLHELEELRNQESARQREELERVQSSLERRLSDANQTIQRQADQLDKRAQVQAQKEALELQLQHKDKELGRLQGKEEQLAQIQEEKERITSQLEELRNQLSQAQGEEGEANRLRDEIAQLKSQQSSASRLADQNAQLRSRLNTTEREKEGINAQLQEAQNRLDQLEGEDGELQRIRTALQEAEERAPSFGPQLIRVNGDENQAAHPDSPMQQQQGEAASAAQSTKPSGAKGAVTPAEAYAMRDEIQFLRNVLARHGIDPRQSLHISPPNQTQALSSESVQQHQAAGFDTVPQQGGSVSTSGGEAQPREGGGQLHGQIYEQDAKRGGSQQLDHAPGSGVVATPPATTGHYSAQGHEVGIERGGSDQSMGQAQRSITGSETQQAGAVGQALTASVEESSPEGVRSGSELDGGRVDHRGSSAHAQGGIDGGGPAAHGAYVVPSSNEQIESGRGDTEEAIAKGGRVGEVAPRSGHEQAPEEEGPAQGNDKSQAPKEGHSREYVPGLRLNSAKGAGASRGSVEGNEPRGSEHLHQGDAQGRGTSPTQRMRQWHTRSPSMDLRPEDYLRDEDAQRHKELEAKVRPYFRKLFSGKGEWKDARTEEDVLQYATSGMQYLKSLSKGRRVSSMLAEMTYDPDADPEENEEEPTSQYARSLRLFLSLLPCVHHLTPFRPPR